jgi:hypothetical protein
MWLCQTAGPVDSGCTREIPGCIISPSQYIAVVTFKSRRFLAMSQKILEPTAAEKEWLRQNLENIRNLLVQLDTDLASQNPLKALDVAFGSWMSDRDKVVDPNSMINAFGIGFGQHLVDNLSLRWAVVSDAQGTEMAVHGQPGDILIFPANFVAKRFTAGETTFFESAFAQFRMHIDGVRASTPKQPWYKLW